MRVDTPEYPNEPASRPADFPAPLVADFRPDEIGGSKQAAVTAAFPVEVVGPAAPGREGWRYELDSFLRNVVARDSVGRVRWRAAMAGDGEAQVNPFGVSIRFSGRLAAVSLFDRVVVFDTLGEAKRLWSRELSSREDVVLGARPRPVLRAGGRKTIVQRDALGRPVGTAGFAGSGLLLYQAGTTVTAADPSNGDLVWRLEGQPRGCTLAGDDRFVVLQPPDASEAIVLNALDGARVATRPTADPADQVAWVGTRLVAWHGPAGGERRLACRDVARDEDRWSVACPAGVRWEPVEQEELALLDPGGRFTVVRLDDGSAALSADVELPVGFESFLPLRTPDRYLLFTAGSETGGKTALQRDPRFALAHGPAYAFERQDGRPLWSAAFDRQQLWAEQPLGLPVLVLTAEHRTFAAGTPGPYHRAEVVDLRTGETLLRQDRAVPAFPFRSAAIDDRSISVVLSGGTIRIAAAGAASLPSVAETPLE